MGETLQQVVGDNHPGCTLLLPREIESDSVGREPPREEHRSPSSTSGGNAIFLLFFFYSSALAFYRLVSVSDPSMNVFGWAACVCACVCSCVRAYNQITHGSEWLWCALCCSKLQFRWNDL